jgi:hypothetical protein
LIVDVSKKGKKKGDKGGSKGSGKGLGSLVGSDAKPIQVSPIKSQDLTEGTLVLGIVLSVDEELAKISLPGGTTGTLALEDYSDLAFTDKVSQSLIGQLDKS